MWMPATPARLISLNRTNDIDCVAIAGVGVGHDRDRDRIDDSSRVLDHLTHAKQTHVRPSRIGCGGSGARHVDDRKTRSFN
jgi:hypothetical protein